MLQVRHLLPPDAEAFCSFPGLSPLTPELLARQQPAVSWLLTDARGVMAGRCSLWWLATPPYLRERTGLIGHYAIRDGEAAARLLELACAELAAQGCTLAVGPLDGSTWHRYRLLTERGSRPPFFLEPDNPDDWPGHWRTAGFQPLAEYYSALATNLSQRDGRAQSTAERLAAQGLVLRPIRLERFREELRAIHDVVLASFCDNFLYQPLPAEDFLQQYLGIRPYLQPELVVLAEQNSQVVGFLFALPDLSQAQRGEPVDTVIVKTMGVRPEWTGQGLGGLLLDRCHAAAHALGYRRAIHALMHQDNRSRRLSNHTAQVIRRYALFARSLR